MLYTMFLSFLTALFYMSSYIGHVQCKPMANGGHRDYGKLFAIIRDYVKYNPETLEEILNHKTAVLEGDMIMPSDKNALKMTWPEVDGKLSVPYQVHPDLAGRMDSIMQAMEMVSQSTCVSFHNRTTEVDYLCFYPSKSCASFVGFRGGVQNVYMGPTCTAGNIAHEVIHALGFYHEHTREDRDQYIDILVDNIMKGMGHNFQTWKGKTFGLPYDSSSIMHYGRFYFSKNGLPTIKAKEDDKMGQRTHLSPLDIKRVRLLYKCDEGQKKNKTETPVLALASPESLEVSSPNGV